MPKSSSHSGTKLKEVATRHYLGLSREVIHEIATFFNVNFAEVPFGPDPTMPLYLVEHRGSNGTLSFRCWPRIDRLDISCGPHAWIVRDITEAKIIEGMEMIFRTKGGGLLTISAEGDVLLSSR